MTLISDTWQITKKDLLEFSRDRMRLITFIIMPIFMMGLTGFIFPNQNSLKNIPIGIANLDAGAASLAMLQTVSNLNLNGNQPAFTIKTYPNLESVKGGIQKQEISGGIVIPANFSQTIISSDKQAEVIVVEDQSNPQISGAITQVLTKVIEGIGQKIAIQKISPQLPSKTSAPLAFIAPIKTRLEGLISGSSNYFDFVAPGIMAMVVMTAVLTGLAAAVSREKEQGTLDGILIAPISRLSIILGKAFAQSVRGLFQGGIVLLLAIFLFGVTIHGNLLLVGLILLLGIFSFVGLGILVSASAAEQETATQVLFMFQFPMLFLSGAFFPLQQMPKIMQQIAHLLPLTYAIEALRKVMILGAGIQDVSSEIIIMFGFGLITLIIAVPLFRRMITR